jgi:hypothetical protein
MTNEKVDHVKCLRAQLAFGHASVHLSSDTVKDIADELERLQAESDAWDKLSLVQLHQTNERLRTQLADCELSLRVWDGGNTSEYWLRHHANEPGASPWKFWVFEQGTDLVLGMLGPEMQAASFTVAGASVRAEILRQFGASEKSGCALPYDARAPLHQRLHVHAMNAPAMHVAEDLEEASHKLEQLSAPSAAGNLPTEASDREPAEASGPATVGAVPTDAGQQWKCVNSHVRGDDPNCPVCFPEKSGEGQ